MDESKYHGRPVPRELQVRACESSLLAAVVAAQTAALYVAFVTELVALHARAGDQRRALEATA